MAKKREQRVKRHLHRLSSGERSTGWASRQASRRANRRGKKTGSTGYQI